MPPRKRIRVEGPESTPFGLTEGEFRVSLLGILGRMEKALVQQAEAARVLAQQTEAARQERELMRRLLEVMERRERRAEEREEEEEEEEEGEEGEGKE